MSNQTRSRARRLAVMALGAATGILVVPTAAWAHAVFLSSSSVPANSDQKLTLNVPEEKGPNVHNTKVVFVVPEGFKVAGCDPKPQWNCGQSAASGGRTLVTYTRTSGDDPDARFSFGVHTPGQKGGYPFNTLQYYSDNSTVRWDGPPDSDNPAPILNVT